MLLAVGVLWACDLANDGIGAPCESDADCGSGLVCDVHDGRGSCQRPHGHDDGGSSTSTTTSTSTSTTDTTASSETGETGGTGGTADTGAMATDTGAMATDTGQTGGAPAQDCLGYCACLVDTCSGFAGYPHADIGECMSACETLDDPTFACFADACFDAQTAEADLVEAQCQQAWGEPGVSECQGP
jgi:hypothetical protein